MSGAAMFLVGVLSLLVGGACDLVSDLRSRGDMAGFRLGYEDAMIRFAVEEEALLRAQDVAP
ncbi:hypothetical protein ACQW02_18415 [Humitalea sp. 24SJ18S-53]|uniref:hypothetical protein n=1 Tax=Humitalea sp. 24SJ18S-53 TaxID=3422307 RepID=UPI003D67831C